MLIPKNNDKINNYSYKKCFFRIRLLLFLAIKIHHSREKPEKKSNLIHKIFLIFIIDISKIINVGYGLYEDDLNIFVSVEGHETALGHNIQ